MLPGRRDFLKASAACAVTAASGALWSPAHAASVTTLKEAAAKVGLRFGSDSDGNIKDQPPEYGALFARECELYAAWVPWARTQPARGAVEPAFEQPNIAFARSHGLTLTGWHLVWHANLPDWFKTLSQPEAESAIRLHITAMAAHYAGISYSWNVVNEAIILQDSPEGLRRSPLSDIFGGSDYIDFAFRAAQASAPNVLRVYNEHDLEMDSRDQEGRRGALLRLLDKLGRQGTPIEAIGLQTHIRLNGTPFPEERYRKFLRDIAGRGLKILITEIDVMDLEPGDVAARDRDVAAMYKRFLSVALDEPAVTAVVTWGLADKYSWMNSAGFRAAPTAPHRPDGLTMRPLLFDDEFKPKPAYYAVLEALQNASPRKRV